MKTMLWLCAGLLVAGSAMGQTRYQCRTPGGAMYLSDRPCGGDNIIYYGPTQTMPPQPTVIPRVGEAPGHLKYMSPRCSGLHDAIRTAPARGLKYETIGQMQRDYQRECGEDEAEARNQFYREQSDQKRARMAERQQQVQQQSQAKMHDQQCEESKRILYMKKKRTDLTEGEKADLQRFEDNYRQRCG